MDLRLSSSSEFGSDACDRTELARSTELPPSRPTQLPVARNKLLDIRLSSSSEFSVGNSLNLSAEFCGGLHLRCDGLYTTTELVGVRAAEVEMAVNEKGEHVTLGSG